MSQGYMFPLVGGNGGSGGGGTSDGVTLEYIESRLQDFAKKTELPLDYLTSVDKAELTNNIATAMQDTVKTILGENVNVDFDTLQEVAEWILADTTGSAELITRVSTLETNLGGHTVGVDVPENAKFTDTTHTNAKLGQGYGTCGTAKATTAKTVSISDYTITKDGVVVIKFTNDVPANATLNINSKGAKPIYYNGSAITSGIINAGDIAFFMYDGTNYDLKGILFTVDGLVEKLGIGNENSHVDGVTSKLAFWRNDVEGTRFECVASKVNNNYITDSITIYTTLTNNQFPSLIIGYDVTPGLDNEGDLGSLNKRWCNIYGATPSISTSDRNKKKDFNNLDSDKMIEFIKGLKPVSYKFIDGQSGRTHYGLISQDVEELLDKLGMTSQDFAGFIKSPKIAEDGAIIEGEYNYALRYEEFIAPLIRVVQSQQSKIDELEERITKLEAMK
jgi:hypothetical protein